MTISGETIDYGPCAFVEAYDTKAVFSSIDSQGRYAFGNQPGIARWNLARLAESLLPLFDGAEDEATSQAMRVIDGFPALYARELLGGQRDKLGLRVAEAADDAADAALADDWLALLHGGRVDFTLAGRRLADAAAGDDALLRSLFTDAIAFEAWLARWRERCAREDDGASLKGEVAATDARAARMRRVNPWLIPRNHRVEEALAAASDEEDLGPFDRLLEALRHPYDEKAANACYAEPAPADVTACYRTFCGT
jgi:uncharacterized protein YdiU (UPF0061 family)